MGTKLSLKKKKDAKREYRKRKLNFKKMCRIVRKEPLKEFDILKDGLEPIFVVD